MLRVRDCVSRGKLGEGLPKGGTASHRRALRDQDGKESPLARVCVTGLMHAHFRESGACLRVVKGGGNLKVFFT